jgi:hypothetical protein
MERRLPIARVIRFAIQFKDAALRVEDAVALMFFPEEGGDAKGERLGVVAVQVVVDGGVGGGGGGGGAEDLD